MTIPNESPVEPAAYGEVISANAELAEQVRASLAAPSFDPSIPIGIVGCGWIAGLQLEAYRALGLNVVAFYDRHPERASAHAAAYYPNAEVHESLEAFLSHPGLRVVDVALHVEGRPEVIRQCLAAGKHVLSQKPFVEDLAVGEQLMTATRNAGVQLASNQNGRWAPHLGALLALVRAGLIGRVQSADFQVAWPHDEVVADKPAFASMEDLILFDFGAHWFDVVGQLAPTTSLEVRAVATTREGQLIQAPVQADAIVTGDDFVAALLYRASDRFAEFGGYRVVGTGGAIVHQGAALGGSTVTVYTEQGSATIRTGTDWFAAGLSGSMREMLAALTDGRRPTHDGTTALRGLEICFAALASVRTGDAVTVGSSRSRRPM